MIAFMIFVAGAAVSLSVFFLGRGMTGFSPHFDRRTLDRVGIAAAFGIYCGAGPVLLVRALDQVEAENRMTMLRNTLAFTLLILLWTGALGIVAVESARALL